MGEHDCPRDNHNYLCLKDTPTRNSHRLLIKRNPAFSYLVELTQRAIHYLHEPNAIYEIPIISRDF